MAYDYAITERKRMKELKLKRGTNKIRIASLPLMYHAHMVYPKNSEERPSWQRYMSAIEVMCSMFHGECETCKTGLTLGEHYYGEVSKFLVAAIDKYSNEEGFIRIGPGIFYEIQRIFRSEKDLDLKDHDLQINIGDAAIKASFGDLCQTPPVVNCSITLLEKSDEPQLSNFTSLDVLEKMCRPPTPESTAKAYEAAKNGELYEDEHQTTRKWFDFSY